MARRSLCALMALLLLAGLWGCKKEDGQTYRLVSIQMGDMPVMEREDIDRISGGEELYLILRPDGTARMKVSPDSMLEMGYADGKIWRTETPQLQSDYKLEGDRVTVYDGASIYIFEK